MDTRDLGLADVPRHQDQKIELGQGVHRAFLQERVAYGRPAAEVVAEEAVALDKTRIFLTTSRSLAGREALPARIGRSLGSRFAGAFCEISAHSPRDSVIAGASAARAAGADLLVAIGGGSVIDATKAMLLCFWEGLASAEQLTPFLDSMHLDPSRHPDGGGQKIRMIAVPTMFSAAEFTWFAGITDYERQVKEIFSHPLFIPQTVVLDPAATLETPLSLLASTGMKAIDHAVEWSCAINKPPLAEAASAIALGKLYRGLPKLGTDEDGLALRTDLQLGTWLSIYSLATGAPVGASHALGHVLGGLGIPHGYTTGLVLPSVLRWNYPANATQQNAAAEVIGVSGPELADAIAELAVKLRVPVRLRDVGIGEDQLSAIAEKALRDASMRTNPRPVSSLDDVCEILRLAW